MWLAVLGMEALGLSLALTEGEPLQPRALLTVPLVRERAFGGLELLVGVVF
jgi:hypothetical protein